MLRIIMGGHGSGKHAFALERCLDGAEPAMVLAGVGARGCAGRRRIHDCRHGGDRSIPIERLDERLPQRLDEAAEAGRHQGRPVSVLINGLDRWLFRLMGHGPEAVQDAVIAFLRRLDHLREQREPFVCLTIVSTDAGFGDADQSCPEMGRFHTELAALHQAVAARADEVCLFTAGLPVMVKGAA